MDKQYKRKELIKMSEQITHLIINWIKVEENEIWVGATDNMRWQHDMEIEISGFDAKTIVYVILRDDGRRISKTEEAGFHCLPGDPTRILAMKGLTELFDTAWVIMDENLDYKDAVERFFGQKILF